MHYFAAILPGQEPLDLSEHIASIEWEETETGSPLRTAEAEVTTWGDSEAATAFLPLWDHRGELLLIYGPHGSAPGQPRR